MSVRRIGLIVVPALVAMAALAPAATGAPNKGRIEEGKYMLGGVQGVLGLSAAGQEDLGAVRFDGGRERYVSVVVLDTAGRPVLAELTQDYNGDSGPELSKVFCGATDQPVRIRPGVETRVYLYAGTCEDGSVSAPTTGTVRATFTRSR
jgi:hypothetical protein